MAAESGDKNRHWDTKENTINMYSLLKRASGAHLRSFFLQAGVANRRRTRLGG
jgi:hypothetical protein